MLIWLAAVALAPRTTVVMVHGAGGGGWEYDLWKPSFERAGYRVIARDLMPVKGGLAKTTFQDYVNQVRAWIPKEGKVVLVGASMGGILVLKAAEGGRASAVVLVNSVPPLGIGKSRKGSKVPAVMKWANGPLKDTEDSMPDSDRKTILWAWKKWRDESGAVMNEIRNGIPAKPPTCPTLVVIGEKDKDIPFETSVAVAKWAGADIRNNLAMSHVGPLMSTRAKNVALDVISWLKARKA